MLVICFSKRGLLVFKYLSEGTVCWSKFNFHRKVEGCLSCRGSFIVNQF